MQQKTYYQKKKEENPEWYEERKKRARERYNKKQIAQNLPLLKTIFEKHNLSLKEDEITLPIIKLFLKNKIDTTIVNDNYYRYLGYYHHYETKNYSEMEKYYLMAIENGDSDAMTNMGYYHDEITKNYSEMEKYYLMAIENGDSDAMNNMGYYHDEITKNYSEMEKYYLMAIENGNSYAMSNMGNYHWNITKNYSEMEKYWLMAIEKGDSYSMRNLKTQYSKIIDFNNIIKVFLKKAHYEEVSKIMRDYTHSLTSEVFGLSYPYLDKLEIPDGIKSVIRMFNKQQRQLEVAHLKKDLPWNVRNMIASY